MDSPVLFSGEYTPKNNRRYLRKILWPILGFCVVTIAGFFITPLKHSPDQSFYSSIIADLNRDPAHQALAQFFLLITIFMFSLLLWVCITLLQRVFYTGEQFSLTSEGFTLTRKNISHFYPWSQFSGFTRTGSLHNVGFSFYPRHSFLRIIPPPIGFTAKDSDSAQVRAIASQFLPQITDIITLAWPAAVVTILILFSPIILFLLRSPRL